MTTNAQRVRLGIKMKIGFRISHRSLFVNDVTGVAPHIERGMPASICGDIQTLVVASQAKVLLLIA